VSAFSFNACGWTLRCVVSLLMDRIANGAYNILDAVVSFLLLLVDFCICLFAGKPVTCDVDIRRVLIKFIDGINPCPTYLSSEFTVTLIVCALLATVLVRHEEQPHIPMLRNAHVHGPRLINRVNYIANKAANAAV
jgi:hypothetical protein